MGVGVRGFTFYGIYYFQVMSLFADTGRVREMWRVAPNRVGTFLDSIKAHQFFITQLMESKCQILALARLLCFTAMMKVY
jgi:hypothetical protein